MDWKTYDWQSQKVGQKGEALKRNDYKCGFCKGKQYLDWIEYILGVDSNYWKINEANWYKE